MSSSQNQGQVLSKEDLAENFAEFFDNLKKDFRKMQDSLSFLNVFEGKDISEAPSQNEVLLMNLFLSHMDFKHSNSKDISKFPVTFKIPRYPVTQLTELYTKRSSISPDP
jgi:hypothetical protein